MGVKIKATEELKLTTALINGDCQSGFQMSAESN